MVNPGAFQGSRKEFLLSQKPAYKAGVTGGYAADALAEIQRKYFKRYPIDLPHSEEPSAEWLAGVDDDAPDIDQEELDVTSEEYATAAEKMETRRSLLTFHKAVRSIWSLVWFESSPPNSKSNAGLPTNS
jgi:hypothetical protein